MGQTFREFAGGNANNITVEMSGAGGPDVAAIASAGGLQTSAAPVAGPEGPTL